MMSHRVYNFNPGPSTLPLDVLHTVQEELLDYRSTGMSIMEISHRSAEYDEINNQAISLVEDLMGLEDNFHVIFVGGGASTQFAHIPINFLSKEKVAAAFTIILSDKNVKGILINIFGGIMRCDVLAKGVIEAAKETKLNVPLVVRLAGTNFEEGKKILSESKLKILSATDLSDAAKKIVEAVG